ncbi:MAG: excinuclease ABC subunit UvrC [Elusimicrobiota bacterium]
MNPKDFYSKLPHCPGVYLMRDITSQIIYIGKAIDLKKRVSSYFRQRTAVDSYGSKIETLVAQIRHIDYVPTASEREALVLERKLISDYKPIYNAMWKDDKSYPYVMITLKEDFPRLLLTRKKKRDGSLYFGPYPNVSSVRHLLKWAWRKKLFPLRPCKFEINEGSPLPYKKVKTCLYLHTQECSAPCLAKITKSNYQKIVAQAKWFFQGKKEKLLAEWSSEMSEASSKMEYEKAAELRDRINTIERMNQFVTIREMTPEMLGEKVGASRAIQELMKALTLKSPPLRIECFDISHIQGAEKVASMVSFLNGKPDKSQYRKFIIKTVKGIDDFKSMAEVVGRRYKRLLTENKALPDLVLIDGGKGQLSFALAAIEGLDIKSLEVAALAKENEEIFRPHTKESIQLKLDSPALLLLRQVRDEAHRFAITFHRARRSKLFFKENLE